MQSDLLFSNQSYDILVVQLVQFAIGIVHSLQIYYVPGCDYPWGVATFELIEALYFFYVFFSFYRKSYWRARNASKKAMENGKQSNGIKDNNNIKQKSI